MHLFHCPELSSETIELPNEEAHHAIHVLRLQIGDRVGLLDGKGLEAIAAIASIGKKQCTVAIQERVQHARERGGHIHLAVGIPKQLDRWEWLVEKAVEVGVDRITPLITERSERRNLRSDRTRRVAIAAMKQSQRCWLPILDDPMDLGTLLALEHLDQVYFGWCEGEHASLMERYTPERHALMVIGPEGDLSPKEAATLIARGASPVSLGHARLRTETAALVACAWMSLSQQP
ncbi:MAG: 16S rRNA (uracil(1498)-N(3))-methyltransferase [Flavobacteriales bacterium]|nr:16S rRNA (uracil(1498)-N(3))-methyltransferase [Flavobacteriales bacterium]